MSKEFIEFTGEKIIIMICSDCNINCRHCYISYKGNRTPEELLQMVEQLKDRYSIELNGAEVLTNLEYLKAYKLLGQHFIISNGKAILENPDTIKRLKENDISTVSLSYHFGIQDKISVITEEDLNHIIKELQENGIEVRLMTTINSKNHDRILEMCEKASDLKVRAIKFTKFISQGNALHLNKNNQLQNDQVEEFFQQLQEARTTYDKEDLLIERCGTFGQDQATMKNNFQCLAMNQLVVITPDNHIYPCVFLAKPGYEIGKYEEGKVLVYPDLEWDKNKCLTDEICNKAFQYKLRKEERI